ncbi:unnamed protein product, partial [Leptidea sinapis]
IGGSRQVIREGPSQGVVMELVILKARAQLNRLVSERRSSRERGGKGSGGARGPGREGGMAPARPELASSAPWHNATLLFNITRLNSTFDTDYELLNASSTDEHDNHWFCAKWTSAQQDLFQAANLCFAIAFLVPKSFKQSILVLRAMAATGAVLMGIFLPPSLSLELTDLYLKLFKPLKVNKKHFQELTREARIVKLEPGEAYAVEDVTPADERLSILLKGKMRLERVLRHRPSLKVVLDCLIGKDITHKLYSVSEGLGMAATTESEGVPTHLTRSASVDAVHEGTRGRLRSAAWRSHTSSVKGTYHSVPFLIRITRLCLRLPE